MTHQPIGLVDSVAPAAHSIDPAVPPHVLPPPPESSLVADSQRDGSEPLDTQDASVNGNVNESAPVNNNSDSLKKEGGNTAVPSSKDDQATDDDDNMQLDSPSANEEEMESTEQDHT